MTSAQQLFPPHLLQASPKDRLDYFKKVIVDHDTLSKVVDQLDDYALPALDRRLLVLVGGAGVGKSAALDLLTARRNARRAEWLRLHPHCSPAILLELEPPDRGAFDFNSLYWEALTSMNAMLVDRTLPTIERRAGRHSIETLDVEHVKRRLGSYGLKRRFKNELISREVELIAIDEAISFFKTGKRRSEKDRLEVLKDQSDKLKTFVNKTPVTMVLAGAFDFFDLVNSSAQLARRCRLVPMESYGSSPKDLLGFAVALTGLVAHLPIAHNLHVADIAGELFLQSLGCVGILKELLVTGLTAALRLGVPLSMAHVRQGYYPKAALKQMADEMASGMVAVRAMMSLTELADAADGAASADAARRGAALKPGETTPSHRNDAASAWDRP